jgi:hypothetical protein
MNTNHIRKISLFFKRSIPNQFWKTLLVLILSVLLIAPTPALAWNSSLLQSYTSNFKIELDSIEKSITELPNLSYENSKEVIPNIKNKLQQLQTEANSHAQEYKELSNREQIQYESNLDEINNLYTAQQDQLKKVQNAEEELVRSDTRFRTDPNINILLFLKTIYEAQCEELLRVFAFAPPNFVSDLKANHPICQLERSHNEAIERSPLAQELRLKKDAVHAMNVTLNKYQDDQKKLQIANQELAREITLDSQTSLFFNKLEQKINLAKSKARKLSAFMLEFSSFKDPDLLNEKNALSESISQVVKTLQILPFTDKETLSQAQMMKQMIKYSNGQGG